MSEHPSDLRYTSDHEWLRASGDRWRVGITSFAGKQLGDVVLVELPTIGTVLERGDSFGTVESVKAVSELYAPISGKVVALNDKMTSDPELVNTDPYGDGWMIELEPSNRSELDGLMTSESYAELLKSEES